jgi:hypothetical protein
VPSRLVLSTTLQALTDLRLNLLGSTSVFDSWQVTIWGDRVNVLGRIYLFVIIKSDLMMLHKSDWILKKHQGYVPDIYFLCNVRLSSSAWRFLTISSCRSVSKDRAELHPIRFERRCWCTWANPDRWLPPLDFLRWELPRSNSAIQHIKINGGVDREFVGMLDLGSVKRIHATRLLMQISPELRSICTWKSGEKLLSDVCQVCVQQTMILG